LSGDLARDERARAGGQHAQVAVAASPEAGLTIGEDRFPGVLRDALLDAEAADLSIDDLAERGPAAEPGPEAGSREHGVHRGELGQPPDGLEIEVRPHRPRAAGALAARAQQPAQARDEHVSLRGRREPLALHRRDVGAFEGERFEAIPHAAVEARGSGDPQAARGVLVERVDRQILDAAIGAEALEPRALIAVEAGVGRCPERAGAILEQPVRREVSQPVLARVLPERDLLGGARNAQQ